jgi:hypothetical protein
MQDAAITSEFASSSADFLGKRTGAFDGTVGDMYSQLNAVGAQVAMGINTFSSYYYRGCKRRSTGCYGRLYRCRLRKGQ